MKKLFIVLAACATFICGAFGLTACSGAPEHSVACGACENGYVIVSDTKVRAGEKVILAAHPNAGYKLAAFIIDGEIIDGVSFVMPDKDVTVSARFEVITYSVTYVAGDAEPAQGNPDTYTVETAQVLTEPQKDGYEVCGWYRYHVDSQNEYEEFDIEYYRVTSLEGLCGNLTLYAKYYNPLHEISESESENGWYYVADGVMHARYGEPINVVVDPHRGYELDYVAVNGEPIEGTSFTMPMCDVELTVNFKPTVYSITYELDGGENSPYNPEHYTVEDGEYGSITIHDAYKEGYIFVGWYYYDGEYEQTLYSSSFDTNICQSVTLYARFIEDEGFDWE